MENENKITVSFRIKPRERDEILAIGFDSFSRGISTLLDHYRKNPIQIESEGSQKIRDAEKAINEITRDYGESSLTEKLRAQLEEFKEEYFKRQIKDTKVILKDIQRFLA
ncbi:MAG: hypothetical protein ACHQYQ_09770 [Bacteriovoracales bacterium]